MAVIEIAKIQVRRGNEGDVGMPQLDSGEFGWAIDTQTLYIGNGSVAEGAPAVGNTEVITANNISNFFNLNAVYTYGSSYGNPYSIVDSNIRKAVTRSVSSKLDDFVNVVDFGAVADWNGVSGTDNTQAFQTAIDNLYLTNTSTNGQLLRIPAGTYYIAGTIYVPPNATITGDGPDKTVLVGVSGSNPLIQLCDGSSPGNGSYIIFVPGQVNITGPGKPTNIYIEGMTFTYTTDPSSFSPLTSYSPLLSLDCVTTCRVVNCKFLGLYTAQTIYTSDTNDQYNGYTGIDIRSQGTSISVLTSDNILIKDCVFIGLKYGITSNYNCSDILIVNNLFEILNRGVNWATNLANYNTEGPIRSRINSNIFDYIYNEGIYAGSSINQTQHISSFNSFFTVGTHLDSAPFDDTNAITPSIRFNSAGNVSVEDKFYRDEKVARLTTAPTKYVPSILGKVSVSSNVAYTKTWDITGIPTLPTALVYIPYAGNDQTINIPYLYTTSGVGATPNVYVTRKGVLSISVSTIAGAGPQPVTDTFTYTYTGGGGTDPEPLNGLTFTATLDTTGNFIKVAYTGNYNAGTIEYQYNYLG
jgi:hypothetical protein